MAFGEETHDCKMLSCKLREEVQISKGPQDTSVDDALSSRCFDSGQAASGTLSAIEKVTVR